MAEAHQSTSCCPSGSWGAPLGVSHGHKSLDAAHGRLCQIGPGKELEVYVASPPSGEAGAKEKRAIVVFTDVYGLQNRLFALLDKLATDLNLTVVALDCFRGETKDDHPDDFISWMQQHPFSDEDKDEDASKVHPVQTDIEWCIEYLSSNHGVPPTNLGAVGFCWGVWAMAKACAMGVPFQCGVGFHPSVKLESTAFDRDQVEMMQRASEKTPLLFCVSGNDPANLKPPEGAVARMIEASGDGVEGRGRPRCVEFPDMTHGWVSRGDSGVEKVREDAETALTMAAEFLACWM